MTERKTETQHERTAARAEPTRDPSFTETMQIGIVVRDLGATVRKYVEDYGIGPWKRIDFKPGDGKDVREYGRPVEHACRRHRDGRRAPMGAHPTAQR